MTFYPNEKLGLFIDGANLYSAARNLDFDIDYKRLLEEFRVRERGSGRHQRFDVCAECLLEAAKLSPGVQQRLELIPGVGGGISCAWHGFHQQLLMSKFGVLLPLVDDNP